MIDLIGHRFESFDSAVSCYLLEKFLHTTIDVILSIGFLVPIFRILASVCLNGAVWEDVKVELLGFLINAPFE